jgi:DNA-binding MarR family transcriptional regulator
LWQMTHITPPPPGLLLDKIARVQAQRFAQRITDLGITPRHVGLLTAAAGQEAPSQSELGAWLGVGPSAVVAIVDELETRGAVVRSPDPRNRRRMIITVTDEGSRLLAEATRCAAELDEELFSELPPELVEAFVAATRLIAMRLGVGGSSTQYRR